MSNQNRQQAIADRSDSPNNTNTDDEYFEDCDLEDDTSTSNQDSFRCSGHQFPTNHIDNAEQMTGLSYNFPSIHHLDTDSGYGMAQQCDAEDHDESLLINSPGDLHMLDENGPHHPDGGSEATTNPVGHHFPPYKGENWEFLGEANAAGTHTQNPDADVIIYKFFGPSTSGTSADAGWMDTSELASSSTVETTESLPQIMFDSLATLVPTHGLNLKSPSERPETGHLTDPACYQSSAGSHSVMSNWVPEIPPAYANVEGHLTAPVPTSPTLSAITLTSFNAPSKLECPYEECESVFTGAYRRSNMQRHLRLKHKSEGEKLYACNVGCCGKVYKRQDALLKHHRSKHPSVYSSKKIPRKSMITGEAGSSAYAFPSAHVGQ